MVIFFLQMKTYFFFLIISFCFTKALVGQDVRCEATVDRTTIEAGETFTLSIEVSGNDVDVRGIPELPALKGIELLYPNPGESTSIQIINGRKSESKSFQFFLRASQTGRWTIPPVSVNNAGKEYHTQAITIEVVGKNSSGSAGSVSGREADVFFAAVAAKKEAYVGEQVMVEFRIYSRVPVTQYSPTKVPNFPGFWAEEFQLKEPIQAERVTINGKTYSSYTIKRMAVFPTHSGDLNIEPAEIECELRIPRKNKGNLFDDFFTPFNDPFGEVVTKKFSSDTIRIHVNDLPIDGKPSDFSGLVGTFDVKTTIDKTQLKTGEAVLYRVEIYGIGNIKSVNAPENPFNEEFEKYPVKSSDEILKNGNIVSGKKFFEFVAIPRTSRTYEIPEYTISYFNPETKKYEFKSAQGHTLVIEQGRGMTAAGNLSKEEVALIAKDIRFIKTSPENLTATYGPIYTRWWYILLLLGPLGLTLVAFVYQRYQAQQNSDAVKLKYRKASPMAKKRLNQAEKLLKARQLETFYAEVAKTLTGLIADKLGISEAGIMTDTLVTMLREKKIDGQLIDDYVACLQLCDQARFSFDRNVPEKVESVYERIRDAIFNMDKAL
ncbi:BatD family protein [bacterium]|nr:BatD family protein [bacterium]